MSKSEIQAKLKSSIEEKLYSLGAYVDKELPEYILVMIANKKNKELMEKDLQLFLGQDTTKFIEWLHDLLGKCHENIEKVSNTVETSEINEQTSRSSPERKKKKDKVRPKKMRKSDEKKEVRKSNVNKEYRSKSRSLTPKKSKIHQSDKVKRIVNTPDKTSKKVILDSKRDDDNVMEIASVVEKPIQKMSSIVTVPERPTHNIDTPKSSTIPVQRESKEIEVKFPDKQPMSSTVKITKRPVQNSDILKPTLAMMQRDIKESVANHSMKRDLPHNVTEQLSERRSSVFARLGNNDLRQAKLSKKSTPEFNEKSVLKRSRDLDQPMESDNDDDTTAWYSHKKAKKSSEEKQVSTNFIVTLKGAEKLNLPLRSRLGPKKDADEIFNMDDESEEVTKHESSVEDIADTVVDENITENTAPVVVTSPATRCKFWPSCKNRDNCPFVHPHELCTNFPNCKFGSACLYMHPNCRFEPHCTKIDCPFTHHQPRVLSALKPVTSASMQQRCLYYPNCTNVNCTYFHPNLPCKFGVSCKAKDTCMFYHPSVPHRTELKWVASEDGSRAAASSKGVCAARVPEAESVRL